MLTPYQRRQKDEELMFDDVDKDENEDENENERRKRQSKKNSRKKKLNFQNKC